MNEKELTLAFGKMQKNFVDFQNEMKETITIIDPYDDTELWEEIKRVWLRVTEMEKDIQIIQTQIRELGKRTPPKEEKPERKSWDFLSIFR